MKSPQGPHTDDSGYTTYQDVPIFQKVSDMYRVFKQCQKDHAEGNLPDHVSLKNCCFFFIIHMGSNIKIFKLYEFLKYNEK